MGEMPGDAAGRATGGLRSGAGPRPFARGERSLPAILSVLWREWRIIVAVPAGVALLAVCLAVITGRGYVAQSKFMPDTGGRSISQFAGLAAQVGIDLGSMGGGESPEFYVALLNTGDLLREAVVTEYQFAVDPEQADSLRGDLVTLYEVDGDTREARVRRATARLRKDLSASADIQAGIVTLEVVAPWRDLAVKLNDRLLELVREFNLERRQSKARAEREFVERRMHEAEEELRSVEVELQTFLRQNRRFEQSPELRFEEARLQRVVGLRQQVVTSLATAYEQARIDEVRSTPVTTVVDHPNNSVKKVPGGVLLAGLLGAVLGGALASGLAFGREYVRQQRNERPDEYAELASVKRRAVTEILGLRFWLSAGTERSLAEASAAAGSASGGRGLDEGEGSPGSD